MTQALPEKLILVRLGEVTLKGLNRGKFISRLIGNMKRRLEGLGRFSIEQSHSRVWVRAQETGLLDDPRVMADAVDRLTRIFGIVSVSPAVALAADPLILKGYLVDYAAALLEELGQATFKIEARRINKTFPLSSYELCCQLGEQLLSSWPDRLKVRMEEPDLTFFVEIRDQVFLYHQLIEGARGLPVGMSGRGMLLLSGGIDSPVAGYMMASRGMILDAIYFHTFPYTGPQALAKVEELASLLARYAGRINLHVVDFTDIQLELNASCPEDMLTIVMRRVMMRIAAKLAARTGAKALITGESLGQVASQTLEALVTTDLVAGMPVFRPLIGLDKNDTIAIARRIGTFETSILPYDDCCTVFVSRHPKTHPSPEDAVRAESGLDMDRILNMALDQISLREIDPRAGFQG